jgi:hypothetical protein
VREVLAPHRDSPERQDAVRLAADRLGLPASLQAGLAPAARTGGTAISHKALEAGVRLEKNALAGTRTHPDLLPLLAELAPEDFDVELHRHLRDGLISGASTNGDLVSALAELDAWAAEEAIDEPAAKQALLGLHARTIERELVHVGDDSKKTVELQTRLAKIRQAISDLG